MSPSPGHSVHIVGPDTSCGQFRTLRALVDHDDARNRHIIHVGPRNASPEALRPAGRHVHVPLGLDLLAGARFERLIDAAGGADLLHLWSKHAIAPIAARFGHRHAAATGGSRAVRVLIDTGAAVHADAWGRWSRSASEHLSHGFVCATSTGVQRLLQRGVDPTRVALIRNFVDFGAINRVDRLSVRRQLEIGDADRMLLVIPPVTRRSGAFVAAWAGLLVSNVYRNVRVVVPGRGAEVDRIARLAYACRHEHAVRLDAGAYAIEQLVAAADMAVYLPGGPAPLYGVCWTMAAGVPIVASAVPAVTELLAHAHNARLCLPHNQKDAARRLLQVVENAEESKRLTETARAEVFRMCSRQRLIEQYRAAYDNLAQGRPIGTGIHDPTLGTHEARLGLRSGPAFNAPL